MIRIATFYRFVPIADPARLREDIERSARELKLLGTVLVALGIGPSVARGRRLVTSGLDASRRQLSAAYWALPR